LFSLVHAPQIIWIYWNPCSPVRICSSFLVLVSHWSD